MLSPKLIIEDFNTGVIFDRTSQTRGAFSYLEGVDIKGEPGVIKNTRKVSTTPVPGTNGGVEQIVRAREMFPGVTDALNGNMLFYPVPFNDPDKVQPGNKVVLIKGFSFFNNGQYEFISSYLGSKGYLRPVHSGLVRMRSRLITPKGFDSLAMWYMYGTVSGCASYIDGGTVVNYDMTDVLNSGKQMEYTTLTGGTIYLEGSDGIYRAYPVGTYNSINVGTPIDPVYMTGTFTLLKPIDDPITGTLITGKKFTYEKELDVTAMFPGTNGVHFIDKTKIYRRMCVFAGQLYIADGPRVYNIDDGLSVFNRDYALNVGSRNTIADMKAISGDIYMIIHDQVEDDMLNIDNGRNNRSALGKWDGTPGNSVDGAAKIDAITEMGPHIYCLLGNSGNLFGIRAAQDAFGGMGDIEIFSYNGLSINPEIKQRLIFEQGQTSDIGLDAFIEVGGEMLYTITGTTPMAGTWSLKKFSEDGYGLTKKNNFAGHALALEEENEQLQLMYINDTGIYRETSELADYSVIETQLYESPSSIVPELWQGVKVFVKEKPITKNAKIECYYRMDEKSAYTYFGDITAENYKRIKYGINRRGNKIMFKFMMYGDWRVEIIYAY